MANIENLKKLRDQLARLPDEKFKMDDWIDHPSCGTVACIAGWASILNGGPAEGNHLKGWRAVNDFAREWLGLGTDEACRLFGGMWSIEPVESITRADAIAQLDHMIAAQPPADPLPGA